MIPSSEQSAQLLAAIKLSRLPGVGAARFKELVLQHGSPAAALEQADRQLSLLPAAQGRDKVGFDQALIDETLRRAAIGEFSATYLGAPDYPWLLAGAPEPPPYLFYKGPLWPLPGLAVAIVGPRRCTAQGAAFARSLAAGLTARGVLVVSGGASGIDTAAHLGALDTGGATVLVTATGVDRVYPSENAELYRRAEERGCVVTELLPGTPPRRDFFPTRNRIIVGLCDAVIVVEGQPRSGSYSSARHAMRMARPIFTWADSPDSAQRELPLWLLEQGATPLAAADPRPVMTRLKSSLDS